jgi:uncharacterized protein YkwD
MKKNKIAAVCTIILVIMSYTMTFAMPEVHTVKKGETLSGIARYYGIDLKTIVARNPQVEDPSLIYPGQKINISGEKENYASMEKEALRIANRERVKRGLQPLEYNGQLAKCARMKAEDMAYSGYFGHMSPNYGSPFKMMEQMGMAFSAAAENLGQGLNTPLELMTVWMNSTGYRNNLLSPVYTQTGIGLAKDNQGRCLWTMLFMKPVS